MTLAPDAAARIALGDLIRRLRMRQRQLQNGQPWAQEDLAVAIGSDKSHVNRIERGHAVPMRATLDRICDALAVSWEERADLLRLAGYLAEPPAPTEEEVVQAGFEVRPFLSSSSHPVSLMDRELRVWDMNHLAAYVYYGFEDTEACVGHLRGIGIIDRLLDPRIFEWQRRVIDDYELYAKRQLLRYRRLVRGRPRSPEIDATVERIKTHEVLGQVWTNLQSETSGGTGVYFLDHQLLSMKHPALGEYTIWIWHSSLATDDRFFLTHHIPADRPTQSVFEHLAKRGVQERRNESK